MRIPYDIFKRILFLWFLLCGSYLLDTDQLVSANDRLFDCLEDEAKCVDELDKKTPLVKSEQEDVAAGQIGLRVWDYIKTFFALIFVVVLLLLLVKWLNQNNRYRQKNRMMQRIGGLSMGQQKSIQLVLIGKTYYILGIGDDVQLLKEVTDPEEIAILAQMEKEAAAPVGRPIERFIQDRAVRFKGGKGATEEANAPFAKHFEEQLTSLKEARTAQFQRLEKKEQPKDD